jgi:putative tricarboxylic transport membrane protein
MVLGKQMEEKFRQAMVISDGSLSIFFTRPIAVVLLLLAVISITNPYWKHIGAFVKGLFPSAKTA